MDQPTKADKRPHLTPHSPKAALWMGYVSVCQELDHIRAGYATRMRKSRARRAAVPAVPTQVTDLPEKGELPSQEHHGELS